MTVNTRIPLDPVLRNLGLALDAQHMLPVFQARIFKENLKSVGDYKIKDCQVKRIKYTPGNTCMFCYRLALEDTNSGHEREQVLIGRIYGENKSAHEYLEAQKAEWVDTPLIKPLMHFEDLDMVLWAFPNDPTLSGVTALTDLDFLEKNFLPQLTASRWGSEWELANLTHTLIRYKPESGCTVRLKIQLINALTGATKPWVVYGKALSLEKGEKTHNVMTELWNAASHPKSGFKPARPLGFFSDHRILWQEGLPGEPLKNQNKTHPEFFRLLGQSAAAIAKLHQTPITCTGVKRIRDIVRSLKKREALVGRFCPAIHSDLTAVVNRLISRAESMDDAPMATLHGDLHLKNILVNGSDIYLIDMDNAMVGSPLLDLGSFSCGAITNALKRREPLTVAEKQIKVFVDSYRNAVPWEIPQEELDWHTAAALIYQGIFRSIRRLKEGRVEFEKKLVNIADELSRGGLPESFISCDKVQMGNDPHSKLEGFVT